MADEREAAKPKRVHWTQTSAGKRILKARSKRIKQGKGQTNKGGNDGIAKAEADEATFAYALGHVECWLQNYADSAGVSAGALAARMGQVLQRKARR